MASAVLPAVKILDQIYSTRITLEGLATRYGTKQEAWPEAVIQSLKARHNAIYSQIEDQICTLGGAYHPLGRANYAYVGAGCWAVLCSCYVFLAWLHAASSQVEDQTCKYGEQPGGAMFKYALCFLSSDKYAIGMVWGLDIVPNSIFCRTNTYFNLVSTKTETN